MISWLLLSLLLAAGAVSLLGLAYQLRRETVLPALRSLLHAELNRAAGVPPTAQMEELRKGLVDDFLLMRRMQRSAVQCGIASVLTLFVYMLGKGWFL